jgi:hypothetical protein
VLLNYELGTIYNILSIDDEPTSVKFFDELNLIFYATNSGSLNLLSFEKNQNILTFNHILSFDYYN